jgi:hypothetical protein
VEAEKPPNAPNPVPVLDAGAAAAVAADGFLSLLGAAVAPAGAASFAALVAAAGVAPKKPPPPKAEPAPALNALLPKLLLVLPAPPNALPVAPPPNALVVVPLPNALVVAPPPPLPKPVNAPNALGVGAALLLPEEKALAVELAPLALVPNENPANADPEPASKLNPPDMVGL